MGSFLLTYPFVTPLLVMLISEVVKHTIDWCTSGRLLRFRHGGIPSSHSAFVTSLMIVVERNSGLESAAFAIATAFAGIVWFDAAFVRSQVGKQAKVINLLQEIEQFSERVGHTLREVLAGIAFGAVVTVVLLS